MNSLDDIIFPILSFNRGTDVCFIYKPEAITYINRFTLKSKPFQNAFIIDATGKKYPVLGYRKLRYEWPYIDILLFDPNYRIALDLGLTSV